MPSSLQYPLERSRGLQQKWARRQQGATARGLDGFTIVAITIPPRPHRLFSCCEEQGAASGLLEVADLSCGEIKPDKAIIGRL